MATETLNKASSAHPTSGEKPTSLFEFWPTWVMYGPVALQWLWLSVRYRSLTLPLLANPGLPLAGMVGESKHALMSQANGDCRQSILPWVYHQRDERTPLEQARHCIKQAEATGFSLPFVCKPDIGCRGAGIRLVSSEQDLANAISAYLPGAGLLCQQLARWEPEVGIFYVKDPRTGQGDVVSLTYKHSPSVIGDGIHTLQQLVALDTRAGALQHLYQTRNKDDWDQVLKPGERKRLVFSASHCRGAVFEDARTDITLELNNRIHQIMSDLPDFYYGRLDVKFADIESLRAGTSLEIVEINGASAESIHIWDKNARLFEAIKTLLWQYRTLFEIGAYHRKQGLRPPGLRQLIRHWRLERRLTRSYPDTH
ncbi:MAG: D-alanine--D-alanine ligase [Natronospirillum sp.]